MTNTTIIEFDEIHTMMYNERTVYFNKNACETQLQEELNDDNKRELIQALYVQALAEQNILLQKTLYGDCNVEFSKSIDNIRLYECMIVEKIAGQLTSTECANFLAIIDRVLNFSPEEIAQEKVQSTKENIIFIATPSTKNKLNMF